MEAAIQLLRSNYVYIQILRLIGQNLEKIQKRVFLFFSILATERSVCWKERDLSVGKREICLLERERSFCWKERDLSVGKREICLLAREICLLARERSVWWQERDLSVGKREILSAGKRQICLLARDRSVC